MPTLAQSLEGQDFGRYQIIAELWGMDFQARDVPEAAKLISQYLPDLISDQWGELPDEIHAAINELATQGGKVPWTQFTRAHGEVREMGPGRRDKELPYRNPISVAEKLWYRGFVGRAFLDTGEGLQEFAFIPDDILSRLPQPKSTQKETFGRPARPEERTFEITANDQILDEACTLLAAIRVGLSEDQLQAVEDWRAPIPTLKSLLSAAKVLDPTGKPNPEKTRQFLEASRGEALAFLAGVWLKSAEFNEVRLMPELVAEGGWENDALAARQKVMEFAHSAPSNQWWSISALIADIKAKTPDFLRPAGDYDSWYLRNGATGEYLRGFEHWDEVDGALIATLIRGPLHWLGFLDLAAPGAAQPATAFRWSRLAPALLDGKVPGGLKVEGSRLKVDSRGGIFVPSLAPRTIRYVISRFTDWLPKQKDAYRFQITARALERARKQGLEPRQLLGLLKNYSSSSLPPNLVQALKRWEQQGTQVRIEKLHVLRLNSAAALKALRSSRAARYLGEPLGPTSIAIKAGAGPQVLQVLVELGYLGTLDGEIS
jgi:hypothetical protein